MAPIYAMLTWKDLPKDICMCYDVKGIYLGRLIRDRVEHNNCWCWGDQPKEINISPGQIKEIKNKQTELWREDAHGKLCNN